MATTPMPRAATKSRPSRSGTGTAYDRVSCPACWISSPKWASVAGVGTSSSCPLGKIQVSVTTIATTIPRACAQLGKRRVRVSTPAPAIIATVRITWSSQVQLSKIVASGAAESSVAPAATSPSLRRPVIGSPR